MMLLWCTRTIFKFIIFKLIWIYQLRRLFENFGKKEIKRSSCMSKESVLITLNFTNQDFYRWAHLGILKHESSCFSMMSVCKHAGTYTRATHLSASVYFCLLALLVKSINIFKNCMTKILFNLIVPSPVFNLYDFKIFWAIFEVCIEVLKLHF